MKFSGKVGFWEGSEEVSPSTYKPKIVERPYTGNVVTMTNRFKETDAQNDDFVVSNQISIVSDLYAQTHFASIKYIIWKGAKLKVTSVMVSYPRITLQIGGPYNGKTASTTRSNS